MTTDKKLKKEKKPKKDSALPDPVFIGGVRTKRKPFIEQLLKAIEKDKENNPYAYTGMIIYPINGRAEGITPIGHYCSRRQEVIEAIAEELKEQEPNAVEEGLKLLESHDVVRIGRIIVEILKYPRSLETTKGAAALWSL